MSLKTDNTELLHDYGIYVPRRTIELIGDINIEMFQLIWRNLHILDASTGTINIILNTTGGDTYAALAIYDAIKGCKNLVRGMIYGECSSSGSIIFQSFDERCMSPNSFQMMHVGEDSTASNHPVINERWHKKNKLLGNWIEEVYLKQIKKKKPRYTRAQLQSLLRFDTILEAKECIEMGLADRIEEHYE